MDERFIEMAEENLVKRTEAQVKMQSAKAIPDADLSPDQYKTTECEDCGVDLPEFRMKKGLVRCVPCQTRLESKRR